MSLKNISNHLLNSELKINQGEDDDETEPANHNIENVEVEASRVEIDMVINSLKNNKAAVEDRICGEILKFGGSDLADEIFKLLSLVWQ